MSDGFWWKGPFVLCHAVLKFEGVFVCYYLSKLKQIVKSMLSIRLANGKLSEQVSRHKVDELIGSQCAGGFWGQLVKANPQRRGRWTTSKYNNRVKRCQKWNIHANTVKSFLYMQGFFWFHCCASERKQSVRVQDQLHSSNLRTGRGSMSLLSSEGFQHWSSCLAPHYSHSHHLLLFLN